jgi:20S proteasome subunit alpha 5
MYLTRSEYDRGVNTFSPEGRLVYLDSEIFVILPSRRYSTCRLFQVEYAIEAVKLGSTVVGIQTKQGSILAIEKRLTSTLLEPSSVEKVMEVDSHIGAAVSGLIGGTQTQPHREAQNSCADIQQLQMQGLWWTTRVSRHRITDLHLMK